MTIGLFELIFLLLILIIGIICTFTDLKKRKIYNKVILSGFLLGIIAFVCFTFYNLNKVYLLQVVINFIISIIVSYVLWFWKLWSAGDAKLFSLFSFLLPLSFYQNSNLNFFPSFNILINLIIPIIATLILLSVFSFLKEKDKKTKINVLLRYAYAFFKISFIYVLLYLILQKVFGTSYLGDIKFIIIYAAFVFFTIRITIKFLRNKFVLSYLITFITIVYSFFLFFVGEVELLKNVLFKVYIFLGSVFLVRALLDIYIDKHEVADIKVKDLKPKILIILDNGKTKKLTDGDVEKIKKEKGENEIEKTYKKFPLSIILFFAVIITILLKGSILNLII